MVLTVKNDPIEIMIRALPASENENSDKILKVLFTSWKFSFPFISKSGKPFEVQPESKFLSFFAFFFLKKKRNLNLILFIFFFFSLDLLNQIPDEESFFPSFIFSNPSFLKKKHSLDVGPCNGFLRVYQSICYLRNSFPSRRINNHIQLLSDQNLKTLNLFEFPNVLDEDIACLVQGQLIELF